MNKDYRKMIEESQFTPITPFLSSVKPISLMCKNCNFVKHLKQAKNAKHTFCKGCGVYSWQKYNAQNIKIICEERGVHFLDDNYANPHEKHSFRCDAGHEWTDSFGELVRKFKRGNKGCRFCVYDSLRTPNELIVANLQKKNINLKSTFTGMRAKHDLECLICYHQWSATLSPILHREVGCPRCNMFLNQKLTGVYVKEILQNAIVIDNFTLREQIVCDGERVRKYLFIDYKIIYNDAVIFIEYNGIHHYKPTNYRCDRLKNCGKQNIEEQFDKQTKRDAWLKTYCNSHNIIFIEIDGRQYTKENIKKYLYEQFSNLGIISQQES